jgi:hypothetical protein
MQNDPLLDDTFIYFAEIAKYVNDETMIICYMYTQDVINSIDIASIIKEL